MNKKNTTLKIMLIGLAVLLAGGFLAAKFLWPKIVGSVVNTAVKSIENMDFSKAETVILEQDLSKNKGVILRISINQGKIYVNGNSAKNAISGEIKHLGNKPTTAYEIDSNGIAYYAIKSADQEGEQTIIHLPKETVGRIDAGIGAGTIDIDLRGIDVPILNVGAGAGSVKVTFSDKKSTQANIAAGAGSLNLVVPSGAGRKVTFEQGANFPNLKLGSDYITTANGFETRDYEKAAVKIDITLGQALGGFSISAY